MGTRNFGDCSTTYLEVLVGSLLPFLVQGAWLLASEISGKAEERTGSKNTDDGVCENFGVLAWGSLRARSVRSKSNPVCCTISNQYAEHIYTVFQAQWQLPTAWHTPPGLHRHNAFPPYHMWKTRARASNRDNLNRADITYRPSSLVQ